MKSYAILGSPFVSQSKRRICMSDFKLTYSTMFNPPDELHTGFDTAVETLKKNMGKEHGMFINGKDVTADEKFDDISPVNTSWVLGKMQLGTAKHANDAVAAARKARSEE